MEKKQSSTSQDNVLAKLGENIVNHVSINIGELRDEFIINL